MIGPPTDRGATVAPPWSALSFRWLLAGRVTSVLGNAVAPVALAFAVLDLTGSPTDLGLVLAARSIANVALLLMGGVFADRLPRSVLLSGSCAVAALTQAVVATTIFTGTASVGLLAGFSALNGAVAAMSLPASAALTAQTVDAGSVQQANALLRIGVNAATIGGAALGGAVVATVGPAWGIAIDAVSFAVAAALFHQIDLPSAGPRRAEEGVLTALVAGWSEVRRRSWVWVVISQFTVLNAAFVGAVAVLGPVVADRTFGRASWGFVLACETVGLLLGAVIAFRWQPLHALRFGVACMAMAAALPAALAVAPSVVPLAVVSVVAGIAMEQFSVAWDVSLQQQIPPALLARVYSYDMLGSFLAIPVGEAAVGPLAARFGVTPTVAGCAAVIVVATLAALATPAVRRLQLRPTAATQRR